MKVKIIGIISLILGALSIYCLVSDALSLGILFMFTLLALNGWVAIYQNSRRKQVYSKE